MQFRNCAPKLHKISDICKYLVTYFVILYIAWPDLHLPRGEGWQKGIKKRSPEGLRWRACWCGRPLEISVPLLCSLEYTIFAILCSLEDEKYAILCSL